jgi:hypothetical protein
MILVDEASVYNLGDIAKLLCPKEFELKSGSKKPMQYKCGENQQWLRVGARDSCIFIGRYVYYRTVHSIDS